MRQHSTHRLALWSAAIVITGIAMGIMGSGTSRAQSQAAMQGTRIASHAAIARSSGTTVELHRKLVHVAIVNLAFHPARLVVSPGTRIVWTNKDNVPHTVFSAKSVWDSDTLDTNDQFARVFKTAGTFSYYCSVHPFMHGIVIVKR